MQKSFLKIVESTLVSGLLLVVHSPLLSKEKFLVFLINKRDCRMQIEARVFESHSWMRDTRESREV